MHINLTVNNLSRTLCRIGEMQMPNISPFISRFYHKQYTWNLKYRWFILPYVYVSHILI